MRQFRQGSVRGVLIHDVYYRITFDYPDNWMVQWNNGIDEEVRKFASKQDAQYFLQERRN